MSESITKSSDVSEKLDYFALGALFLISLCYALVRSAAAQNPYIDYQYCIVLLVTCSVAIMVWISGSERRASYFLGTSPALGTLPHLPYLSSLQQFTHILLIVVLVAACRSGRLNLTALKKQNILSSQAILVYFAFLGVAAISVLVNFMQMGSVWQIKVGISSIVVPCVFGLYLVSLATDKTHASMVQSELIKGFLHSLLILSVVGVVVILLILTTPLSMGTNNVGNDTIFGLGYFQRMQLMFTGPTVAGIFFVISIPFVLQTLQNNMSHHRVWNIYLQVVPWLIMASGSRIVKIAMIATLLLNVLHKPCRRVLLVMFPSVLIACSVSLFYQSLPDAMYRIIGVAEDTNLSLKGRFFVDHERSALLQASLVFFKDSPTLQQLIGSGYGVAGFRTSNFPEAHMQLLDTLIECGILGATLLALFVWKCGVPVFRSLQDHNIREREFALVLFCTFITLILFSLVYEISNQGITLVFFALMVSWADAKSTGLSRNLDKIQIAKG